jgi:hypothetical protein
VFPTIRVLEAARRAHRPTVERKLAHLLRRRHGGRRAHVRGLLRVAQGPSSAAHLHPSWVADGHEPLISKVQGTAVLTPFPRVAFNRRRRSYCKPMTSPSSTSVYRLLQCPSFSKIPNSDAAPMRRPGSVTTLPTDEARSADAPWLGSASTPTRV